VIVMGEADVRDAVGRLVAMLRDAGRSVGDAVDGAGALWIAGVKPTIAG